MNLHACLQHCKVCSNRKMDTQTGLLCGISGAKPNFTNICPDFKADEKEVAYYRQREQQLVQSGSESNGGFFATEEKAISNGVLGGVAMMIIAVIWFVVGYSFGRIFFYPPVLFLIGVYAVIKGVSTNNYTGQGG